MRRSNKLLSEQDKALWTQYVTELRPLKGRVKPPVPPVDAPAPPAPAGRTTSSRVQPALKAVNAPITIGEAPPGLDRATWRRFRIGRSGTCWRIDLHGLNAQHAYDRFLEVITDAAHQDIRCVEIITGRGNGAEGGTLRRELPLWLNLPHIKPMILAATHPHPANLGSVRLLIRRPPAARKSLYSIR